MLYKGLVDHCTLEKYISIVLKKNMYLGLEMQMHLKPHPLPP